MPSEKPAIALVIPCYNEADRLPVGDFIAFHDARPDVTLIFVNDGSSDKTIEVILEMTKGREDRIWAVDRRPNRGKGATVRAGVRQALEHGDFAYVGYFDADLATPLEEVDTLVAGGRGRAFILGSRLKLLGRNIDRKPSRHYFGRVFATLADNLFHFGIYDTQCGAKLIRADLAAQIFERPFLSPWLFDIELLCRTRKIYGDKFAENAIEVPLNTWIEKGDSRINPGYIFKVPFELLRIRRFYRGK